MKTKIIIATVGYLLVVLTIVGAVVWVIAHFVSKFW